MSATREALGSYAVAMRDYQSSGLGRINAALERGRRVLAVAPTGAGKGTMIAALAVQNGRLGKRALAIAHRREIVLDLRDRIYRDYARVGIVLPGERPDPGAPIQVASTGALLTGKVVAGADLVIVDEAHHYVADEWSEIVKALAPAALVGFTATPQRADGRAMGDAFDELIEIVTYSQLLERGLLARCDVLRPSGPTGMDLAQDPAAAYLANAAGRSAFLFTPDVASANAAVRALRLAGVRAATVHANTPAGARSKYVEQLRTGALRVIANAYTMTEGVDMPRVDTIVLARNCAHWGAYVQMTGRGLRPYPGKQRALLIDLHGVSHVHGLPAQDRKYTLDGRGQAGAEEMKAPEHGERRDAFVLGLPLELVMQPAEAVPAPPDVVEAAPRKKPSAASFWAALMRDVKLGVLSMSDAQKAYLSQHSRSA